MNKTHKCAAIGCIKIVPNSMLMCRNHWFAVPQDIRLRVWKWHAAKGRGVEGADVKARESVREAVMSLRPTQVRLIEP